MAAAAAIALAGCSPAADPVPDPAPSSVSAAPRSAQAQVAASAFLSAARSGDRTSFAASFSTEDPAFADRARLLFDNLHNLPLTSLTARLGADEHPLEARRQQLLGPQAWTQPAVLSWQLSDDTQPAQHTVWLTFLARDGRVQVAGAIDTPAGQGPQPQPIWWLAPVTSAQQATGTVLVGPGQSATDWGRAAERAAGAVARHLPSTARGDSPASRLVVEVPATTADFEAVVGAAPGSYAEVAAVTLSEGPTPRSALRVVVNPAAARRLSADGLAVTLAHEAVHVATHSPESAAPTWAVEGLADYVALLAYPEGRAAVAKPLLAEVRLSGAPKALPAAAAFAASADRLDLAYAQAWLFCRYLAETSSPAQLGRLYRELDRGRTLDQAADEVLQSSGSRLTAGWRRWLQAQADGP